MTRRLWGMAFALLLGMLSMVGCAPKTTQNPDQRVAGKEEPYMTAQPTPQTNVTVRFTDTGINISPASIPTGNFTVKIINDTDTAQTFTWGTGTKASAKTLRPGETVTVAVANTKPGAYTITMPAEKKGAGTSKSTDK